MIRNISLIFSMLFLLIFQNILSDGLSIKSNIPKNAAPGSEFIVELTISKDDIKGFALLTQELPSGFTAEAINNNNASFTFIDQKVKFIWIELPTQTEFNISYKVKVDKTVTGKNEITGSFSYLVNSDKKVYPISSVSIDVAEEDLALNDEMEQDDDDEKEQEKEEVIVDKKIEAEVKCKRNINYKLNSEFVVEVIINKTEIGDFAKLQETLPEGFTATSIESNNAQFSFSNQIVKFVWMTLPEQNEFRVSYLVKKDPQSNGNNFLNGEFSYVEIDGETKKCIVSKELIDMPEEEQPVVAKIVVQEKKEEKKEPEIVKTAITETSNAKQKGIVYKVQIAAGHTLVKEVHFVEKYSIKEPIYTEMHEGWNKYTIGSFSEYDIAKKNCEATKSNEKIDTGPFITAYNQGKRITVQEALMISNQKWIK
ncbi:MAG: hypothetical protein H0V01_02150 [Bacteroidetes bacterium]|nr:hypothetical protein [Bacteroidota bacterium]HET6243601.1 hypothetical protein [Bacteroidia bacterium]